jgi:hypothetical protein
LEDDHVPQRLRIMVRLVIDQEQHRLSLSLGLSSSRGALVPLAGADQLPKEVQK